MYIPSCFIAATSRHAWSIVLGSASVSLAFLAWDSSAPPRRTMFTPRLAKNRAAWATSLRLKSRKVKFTAQKRRGTPSPRTKPFLSGESRMKPLWPAIGSFSPRRSSSASARKLSGCGRNDQMLLTLDAPAGAWRGRAAPWRRNGSSRAKALIDPRCCDRPGTGKSAGWRSSVCWPSRQATWVRMAGAPARISSPAKVLFIKVVMRLRSYAREGSASFRQVRVHTLVDNCPRSVSPHVESIGARSAL